MNDQLKRLVIASLTDEDCPADEQLADFFLGTLKGNDQLIVAAHVRNCPFCQQLMMICRAPEVRPRQTLIARLVPLAPQAGLRGADTSTTMRQYQVADINMLIEILVAPPEGERWSVTGRVTRNGAPIAAAPVAMHTDTYDSQQTTDTQGFFAFERLPSGRYTLEIQQPPAHIEIPDLILVEDEA